MKNTGMTADRQAYFAMDEIKTLKQQSMKI